jgi:hypothetical protein
LHSAATATRRGTSAHAQAALGAERFTVTHAGTGRGAAWLFALTILPPDAAGQDIGATEIEHARGPVVEMRLKKFLECFSDPECSALRLKQSLEVFDDLSLRPFARRAGYGCDRAFYILPAS